MYKPCIFIVHCLFVPTNAHIYIKISNYITKAPKCFDVSVPSSGSFDIALATTTFYQQRRFYHTKSNVLLNFIYIL
jgi:hypothetical protein